jgi:hypothetical protein
VGDGPAAPDLSGNGVRRPREPPAPDDLELGVTVEPTVVHHCGHEVVQGAAPPPDGQHHLPVGVLLEGRVPTVFAERLGGWRGQGEVLPGQERQYLEAAIFVERATKAGRCGSSRNGTRAAGETFMGLLFLVVRLMNEALLVGFLSLGVAGRTPRRRRSSRSRRDGALVVLQGVHCRGLANACRSRQDAQ